MGVVENRATKPYLVDNNPALKISHLEQRMDAMLSEQLIVPMSVAPLPSATEEQRPSILRRLLIKLKTSRWVIEWLPKHPKLYRYARKSYHLLKRVGHKLS
jgi:predicted thioredoxin/glutaredoxin